MSLARLLSASPPTRPSTWWFIGLAGALLATHRLAARVPTDDVGPLAISQHLYAILLLGALLWLGAAVGFRLLGLIGPVAAPTLETALFATGLGLGAIAHLVLACGLLGLLRPALLAAMLGLLALATRAELHQVARLASRLPQTWPRLRGVFADQRVLRLTLPLIECSLLLLALRALAPTTGYDALLYHLAGPRQMLEAGRIGPLPELMQANMPFTVNLLYLVGLAAGTHELANLLHLAFAVLTALATLAFGRRFFDVRVGVLAAVIFLSAPALAVYGPVANVDFGWAYFDFLAVYAVALWAHTDRARWLVVAGLLAGLSMGSKYLGALTAAALGAAIIWRATRRGGSLAPAFRAALAFGLPAGLVAAPWYLKNWLWLGSPVWPFLAPGVLDEGAYFAAHMHGGRTALDHLLLPLRLYVGGVVELPAAVPPIALVALPLYLLVRKQRLVTWLLALAAFHFAVWSQGIQTLRYLFPIFPLLSLAAAYVVGRALDSAARPRFAGRAAALLVLASVAVGSGASAISFGLQQSWGQLVGLESREQYLRRGLHTYPAVEHLNDRRAEVGRVLVIGDAPVFHFDPPVVVDQNLGLAAELMPLDDPSLALDRLRAAGVTHVFVSQGHLAWLALFDPERRVMGWWTAFQAARESFLIAEFSHDVATVYRVADAPIERSRP